MSTGAKGSGATQQDGAHEHGDGRKPRWRQNVSQKHMIEDGFVNVHPMLLEDVHHAIVDLPCSECPLRGLPGSVS
jgi:hypothetical protein